MKKAGIRIGRKTLAALLSCAMVFATVPLTTVSVMADDSTVTIYHTNDIHGKLNSTYAKDGTLSQIGMDVLATAKKNTPNSLLVDSGDVSQGQLITAQSKGSFAFTLMNAAGYDLMCLGNHEFDYGLDTLLSNVKSAKFPVLAANADRNGSPLLKNVQSGIDGYDNNGASIIKTVAGKKIGFFGITTAETAFKTNPNNLGSVTFENEVKASQKQADALKASGADLVVGVMHVGIDASSNPTSTQIAKDTTGIDIILDGHSHSVDNEQVKNKDGSKTVYIDQTGTAAAKVGVLKVSFGSAVPAITSENVAPADFGKQFPADTSVTAVYDAQDQTLDTLRKTIVGKSENALYGGTYEGKSVCRVDETNLGSLIADAMVEKSASLVKDRSEYASLPIVSLENGGGVRTTLPAGNITVADVNTVLPFGNTLSVKEVTPAVLYKALEVGVSGVYKDGQLSAVGGFPQVGGMRFEFDVFKPAFDAKAKTEGSRVTKIVLLNKDGTDGKVLNRTDNTTKLLFASNDYLIAGGDNFTMLSGLKAVAESDGLDTIVQNYITEQTANGKGSFRYDSKDRCQILYSGMPASAYTGSFTVKQNDKAKASAKVLVSVDGGKKTMLKTTADGVLTIEKLKAGGHAVEVFDEKGTKIMDEFTNNLLGLNAAANDKPFVCDTTSGVSTKVGKTYFALVTIQKGAKVSYTSGSGSVLATLAKAPQTNSNGTVSYLFGYKALKKGEAGLYVTVNGTAYKMYRGVAA